MDFVSSFSSTSDESSCDDLTGPTTPDSSPSFRPSHPKDIVGTRFSHYLNCAQPPNVEVSESRPGSLVSESFRDFSPPGAVTNICVIGAGYVGGPTAAVIALHNPSIIVEVLDRDQRRIMRWNSSHLPIQEPGLNSIVRVTRDGAQTVVQPDQDSELCDSIESNFMDSKRLPNLIFTFDSRSSISKADIVFLAVNTPTKTFGLGAGKASNMTALDEAVKEVAVHAKPGTVIVEKSTVPCGTAQRIRRMLEALRPSMQFEVLSNPEFLSEGTAIENLMRPDRVLIGSSSTPSGHLAASALSNVYASWIPRSRILSINAWSSELAKLVVNAMLAQRISSINSISAICEVTGADVDEIAKSVGLDPRIGPQFLKAGLGFGGSCFRKDISSLSYLAESLGLDEVGRYWSQVNSINELQRHRFARKVVQRFNENLVGKKITLLGFAFKKNTGDTRESLAMDVIKTLSEERPAEIAIFDPCCREVDILREIDPICMSAFSHARDDCIVKVYTDPYQACSQANAVLIITDCDQFHNTPSKTTTPWNPLEKPSLCENENTYIFKANPFAPTTDSASTMSLSYQYILPPPPACASDCPECAWGIQSEKPPSASSPETLEWARIAYGMKEPKWVFDGRAMLDVAGLERLGVNVERLGRRRAEDAERC